MKRPDVIGSFFPQTTISKELTQILIGNVTSNIAGVQRKDGNGTCDNPSGQYFGGCGPGTATPGNIWTIECHGHDYCVCAYSHLDCMHGVPVNCGVTQNVQCYSFWQAAESWFNDIWDMIGDWWTEFVEWVSSWFEQPPTCPPNVRCQT